jgi:hypothetical protein
MSDGLNDDKGFTHPPTPETGAMLRCPFCGGEWAEVLRDGEGDYNVYCHGCYAQGPPKPTGEEAATGWKRIQQELDVLVELLHDRGAEAEVAKISESEALRVIHQRDLELASLAERAVKLEKELEKYYHQDLDSLSLIMDGERKERARTIELLEEQLAKDHETGVTGWTSYARSAFEWLIRRLKERDC